ncbi:MAG: 4Fe-4S binding protein [Kiritimatiellia bacterium]|jgi:Pyruvate/2-oxoacid:ferredoxin oxidoreductase delta subunit|nr:4Fe-4S binding protein [Kiritimatiellia bacterium]
MKRKIISIDEDLCNGCGLCVSACHEGAIQLVNGKAKLVSDSYCDGLGDCLPACPTDAIQMIEREAAEYDEAAVQARMAEQKTAAEASPKPPLPCGCPGQMAKTIERKSTPEAADSAPAGRPVSELTTWPVQIKLVNPGAPYLKNAALLVAADCTAFAYADIHNTFMRNKVTLIGCPKLDEGDYAEKLTAILQANDIKSLTVLRMEVPCCGGIADAAKRALQASGKMIPWQIVTVSTDGSLLEE